MAQPNVIVQTISGMASHANELAAEVGSASVADNIAFNRDGLPECRNGFRAFNANVPAATPSQLLVGSNGVDRYMQLDNGLWFYNTSTTRWEKKRTSAGAKTGQPRQLCLVGTTIYYTIETAVAKLDLLTGARSIIAGRIGTPGFANGTGDAVRFGSTYGICSDGTNLYVCDTKNGGGTGELIRKIVIATGAVTTFAGTTGTTGTADGTGAGATFSAPFGICTDGTNLYVTDYGSGKIRKITIAGAVVTTVATIGAGGSLRGIAYLGSNLYVCESAAPNDVAKVTLGGVVSSFSTPFGGTGQPYGICTDGTNLYVTDDFNHLIAKVTVPGAVSTTLYGTGAPAFADGIGTAAAFSRPDGVVFDGTNLFVADYSNDAIRKIYVAIRHHAF